MNEKKNTSSYISSGHILCWFMLIYCCLHASDDAFYPFRYCNATRHCRLLSLPWLEEEDRWKLRKWNSLSDTRSSNSNSFQWRELIWLTGYIGQGKDTNETFKTNYLACKCVFMCDWSLQSSITPKLIWLIDKCRKQLLIIQILSVASEWNEENLQGNIIKSNYWNDCKPNQSLLCSNLRMLFFLK